MERYIRQDSNLRPSAWKIADDAFRDMLQQGQNHSILISGVSGAGKTEACKTVIRYLNKLSCSMTSDEKVRLVAGKIATMIEESSPILEAFGNAKTVNNDNSSRFGKFIKLLFDRSGIIQGAHLENYLLEKSRLISPGNNERSYHIFYQLLAIDPNPPTHEHSANAPLLTQQEIITSLKLEGKTAEDFPCLNYGNCTRVDTVDDVDEFRQVLYAFKLLGFSKEDQQQIFNVLGAVLHLQLIQFTVDPEDHAAVSGSLDDAESSLSHLQITAQLLGIPSVHDLAKGLTTKTIHVPKADPIVSPIAVPQAEDARDAFIKHLYSNTFNWIIHKINSQITPKSTAGSKFIGILDIFGFELFDLNSFEQFCINFANESLQHHYNDYNFKKDMKDCRDEGIDVTSVSFNDNTPCIHLITGSKMEGQGILEFLDDQCNFPRSTDTTFLNTIIKEYHGKKPDFLVNKAKQMEEFIINHYAAQVDYNVNMWLDKNRDRLKEDLLELTRKSTSKFISTLIPEPVKVRGKPLTVGGQFRKQLASLMESINSTHPAWIRCIKSHSNKQPSSYHRGEVIEQMRSSGVLETVKMRREGFSVRMPMQQFWEKYRIIISESDTCSLAESCQKILDQAGFDSTQGQVGKTKVFIRTLAYPILNHMREKALRDAIEVIQAFAQMRCADFTIQQMIWERDRALMEEQERKRLEEEERLREIREEEERLERECREEEERIRREEEERQRKIREEQERIERERREAEERRRREEEERQRLVREEQERLEHERREEEERLRLERERRERERQARLEAERKRQAELEAERQRALEEARRLREEEERKRQEVLDRIRREAEERERVKQEQERSRREKIERARKRAEELAREKQRRERERIAAAKEERRQQIRIQKELDEKRRLAEEQIFQEERARVLHEEKERFHRHLENQEKKTEQALHNRHLEHLRFKQRQIKSRQKIKIKMQREKQEREMLRRLSRKGVRDALDAEPSLPSYTDMLHKLSPRSSPSGNGSGSEGGHSPAHQHSFASGAEEKLSLSPLNFDMEYVASSPIRASCTLRRGRITNSPSQSLRQKKLLSNGVRPGMFSSEPALLKSVSKRRNKS